MVWWGEPCGAVHRQRDVLASNTAVAPFIDYRPATSRISSSECEYLGVEACLLGGTFDDAGDRASR